MVEIIILVVALFVTSSSGLGVDDHGKILQYAAI